MPSGPKLLEETTGMVEVAGGRILVRIYRPAPGPLPVHLFIHGGGWCVGTLDERDPRCRQIAKHANCVVVSIDYRLAPENAFPTGLEDCYRVLRWVVDERDRFGLDTDRISVGGESAGANLAAALCILTQDRGGPPVHYQWLDAPVTDLRLGQPAMLSTPEGYLLHRDDMAEYRDAYLTEPGQQLDPLVSPLLVADASGLPPAWITTCGADPLRDDGRAYAALLSGAGVPVTHRHLPGHVHPSFGFTRIRSAAAHERDAIRALRTALHVDSSA